MSKNKEFEGNKPEWIKEWSKLGLDKITIKEEIGKYLPKTTVEEAITLFNFYQKESCEIVNGLRVPVREEYLEQYKTMESWLKNKHNDYKVIDNN